MTVLRILAVLALVATGCTDATSGPVSRDAFIDVMVELRQAAHAVRDSTVFALRRDSILRAHGVTDSMLVEYVRRSSADVRLMAEIWDTIDARLATPADTAA